MQKKMTTAAALLCCLAATSGLADDHAYIGFNDAGDMIISGPFDAVIPKPPGGRPAGPLHTSLRVDNERLKTSQAGFFADDRFVMVQVETTDAPAGTLTNSNLPVIELAGEEFRARTACMEISQEELDMDDDPIFEFIERQNVQIVPAVNARQLFVTNDDGTAEGVILYMRNVGSCDLDEEFEKDFDGQFENFVASIREANQ